MLFSSFSVYAVDGLAQILAQNYAKKCAKMSWKRSGTKWVPNLVKARQKCGANGTLPFGLLQFAVAHFRSIMLGQSLAVSL